MPGLKLIHVSKRGHLKQDGGVFGSIPLYDAKPLPELMLTYCRVYSTERTLLKTKSKQS